MKQQQVSFRAAVVPVLLLLLVLLPTHVQAFPNGAGACPKGKAAPDGFHMPSVPPNASIEQAGYQLSITNANGETLTVAPGSGPPLTTGQSYTLTLGGAMFRGYLFRVEPASPGEFSYGSTSKLADVCTQSNEVGITHTENSLKDKVTITYTPTQQSGTVVLDLSVVTANNANDGSIYSYTGYSFPIGMADVVAPPPAAPVAQVAAPMVAVPTPTVAAPMAPPVSTPAATPMALPVSTPVTAPLAPPVATPVAAPVLVTPPMAAPMAPPVAAPIPTPVALVSPGPPVSAEPGAPTNAAPVDARPLVSPVAAPPQSTLPPPPIAPPMLTSSGSCRPWGRRTLLEVDGTALLEGDGWRLLCLSCAAS